MKQTHAKRERIIEAVRQGLEGDAAVDFVRLNGYAITSAGIAHHLRMMGGRARVIELIEEGKSNHEILARCFPDENISPPPPEIPSQPELFEGDEESDASQSPDDTPPFETTKLTLALPNDLYEAVRIAGGEAHAIVGSAVGTGHHCKAGIEAAQEPRAVVGGNVGAIGGRDDHAATIVGKRGKNTDRVLPATLDTPHIKT